MLDKTLIAFLECPVSGGSLEYDVEQQRLISRQAGLAYPITDGMPQLLEDEAVLLDSQQK